MNERYKVTSETVNGVTSYYVIDTTTGKRKGLFDCQRWADECAAALNKVYCGARKVKT